MEETKKVSPWPVYIALAVLVIISLVVIIETIRFSSNDAGISEDEQTAETYMDIIEPLLVDADPERGNLLLQQYGCTACHGGAGAGHLAPDHAQLAAIAGERRPPLTAAAYIYESIIYPGAFLVEGFPNNMPRIFGDMLSDDELGDMIAYLLGT